MDYKKLTELSFNTVKDGVKVYYDNAKDLLDSAELLALNKKYGQAIALTVLSIEEFTKAMACTMYCIGEGSLSKTDPVFKGNFGSSSVHTSRLKYALGLNLVLSKVNLDDISNKVIKEAKGFFPPPNFKSKQEISVWMEKVAQIAGKELSMEGLGMNEEISNELMNNFEDHENWFNQAKSQKERGTYVDYNHKWLSPKDLKEQDYLTAKKHASEIFLKMGEFVERYISKDYKEAELMLQLMQMARKK